MFSKMKQGTCAVLSGALLVTGLAGLTAAPAQAACNGDNSREVVSVDPRTGGETHNVKVDSCKAQDLVDGYGKVKDGAGLAGLLGAKWWPVGVAGGVFYGWAWNNQGKVKDCASGGSGIQFKEINGIVTGCSAQ